MARWFTPQHFSSPSPRFFFLGLAVVIATSCVADHDESLPSASPQEQRVDAASDNLDVRSLRRSFPDHADRVLGKTFPRGFVASEKTFVAKRNDPLLVHLNVELPRSSQDPVRLIAPGGHEIRVRQIDVQGPGELTDRAVIYRRAGGTSFWTVTGGGAEEWLHLEAGVVTSDLDLAAEWEIEGATPVLMNGSVALMDGDGVARAWVTAPEAHGAEGRLVELRLSVERQRIQLFADAQGEEVLLDPGWVAVAPITGGYYGSTATTLGNGHVLYANGYNGSGIPSTTQLYNPATNVWTPGPNMIRGRYAPAAVLLNDGRVLVIGGQSTAVSDESSIEVYNPATNTWSFGAAMAVGRRLPAAALLNDGRVLVAGGYAGSTFHSSAQIYNPTTNTWTNAGNMVTQRAWAHATRLADGRILVAGGINGNTQTPNVLASAEIYNPPTNSWTSGGNMLAPRYLGGFTRLATGKVLAAGGVGNAGDGIIESDLFNPATNTWEATTPLPIPMGAQAGIPLGSTHFMSATGYGIGATIASSASYNPINATWTIGGDVAVGRYLAAVTTLANGDALVISGTTDGFATTNAVDRYEPVYLTSGEPCQFNAECGSGFCTDGVCCDSACNAGPCDACSVAAGSTADGTCELFTGNPCDDANACTQTDTCQAGICTGTNPITCTPLSQCHNPGICDPSTGVCSNPVRANGSLCNDGNGCTQTDQCQNGVCNGTNPVVCTALSQCHTIGTCNPTTGACSNPRKPDGTMCDDSNACTPTDTCESGACIGANPIKCVATDQCHDIGTCNPTTGTCSNPLKANGSSCDDSNACTQLDTCQTGVCIGSMPTICTASDQCHTAGFCDAISGACTNPIKGNGTACNDGDACTKKDTCNAGVCTGANPVVCAASDSCHDVGTCDSMTGLCSNPSKADGATCDDGDPCTQADTCVAGNCQAGDNVVCAAADECHDVGTCDSANGACSNPPKIDGTPCSVGTCQNGECKMDGGSGGAGGAGGMGGAAGAGGNGGKGGAETVGSGSNASSSTGGSGGAAIDEGSCGCRVIASNDSSKSSAFAGLAFAAMVILRRRREQAQ